MNKISSLLQKTSRTFAISIPLLPEPTRQEVALAYLVFRIVDTFEDGALWSPAERIAALDEVRQILQADDRAAAAELARRCRQQPPVARGEYLELLDEMPLVLASCAQLRPSAAAIIRRHAVITAAGMTGFVHRTDTDGILQLQTLQDLRDYCYVVAGVVGDMLTELFLLDRPELHPLGSYLRARARLFGEALQVVNILKDAGDDGQEGRIYLPAQVSRDDVFALAREDLRQGHRIHPGPARGRRPGRHRGLQPAARPAGLAHAGRRVAAGAGGQADPGRGAGDRGRRGTRAGRGPATGRSGAGTAAQPA